MLLQLIARLGRWLRTALNQSYLRFFKPEGLLSAAGFDKDRLEGYFDERFCLDVCKELVHIVFPFLQDLIDKVRDHACCCSCLLAQPQEYASANCAGRKSVGHAWHIRLLMLQMPLLIQGSRLIVSSAPCQCCVACRLQSFRSRAGALSLLRACQQCSSTWL